MSTTQPYLHIPNLWCAKWTSGYNAPSLVLRQQSTRTSSAAAPGVMEPPLRVPPTLLIIYWPCLFTVTVFRFWTCNTRCSRNIVNFTLNHYNIWSIFYFVFWRIISLFWVAFYIFQTIYMYVVNALNNLFLLIIMLLKWIYLIAVIEPYCCV